MRTKQILLSLAFVPCFFTSCNSNKSYTLTFYQPHGNHSDDYTVNIGKTTLDDIKTHANGLKDYSKEGYDRVWDWDNYDFANQKEDWTITALNPLHNYKISFQYEGVEKGSTTYTMKDSDYTVPTISPEQKGFEYIEKEHLSIAGKKEDLVSELDLQRCQYKMRFFVSDDDKNPTVVDYNFDNPSVTAPKGPEGYDSTWSTKDGTISFNAEETKNIKTTYGEDKLGNYDLYLSKTAKKFTVRFNANGGTMEGETTKEITFGDPVDFPVPTFKKGAKFLGWSSSGKLLNNGDAYNIPSNATLYARYGIDFENESNKDLVINGSRTTFADTDKTLDSSTFTEGSKSLKIVTTNATFSASFDDDFLTSVFADPSVNALNFDCKTETNCTKFSYANSVSHPYEFNCCTNDQPGYGAQTIWKTFSLTRKMYDEKPAGQNCLLCTVGGQLPVGNAIWIDNIRPSSTTVNLLGFEGSRMVPKDDSSSHYKKSVSFRDFSNAELFCITTGYTDAINFGFDYQYKSEGLRSIHYEHKANTNVWLTLPQIDLTKIKEVSFDICLSKAYNGNTVRDGNGNELFSSSTVIDAYAWKTFTIPVAKISTAKQFCTVTSSVECDFWVDNIKIVNS